MNLFLDGLLRRGHVPQDLADPLILYGERIQAKAAELAAAAEGGG